MIDIDTAFRAYLECALWSSTDDDGTPLDRDYNTEDLILSAQWGLRAEFTSFCLDVGSLANHKDYVSDNRLGHDFWLTRNGHGAGFWDGDWGEIGDQLTEISKEHREIDLYVTDDGELAIC